MICLANISQALCFYNCKIIVELNEELRFGGRKGSNPTPVDSVINSIQVKRVRLCLYCSTSFVFVFVFFGWGVVLGLFFLPM